MSCLQQNYFSELYVKKVRFIFIKTNKIFGNKMVTKERVKREIDRMPNELLEKVYKFINGLKTEKPKKKFHTYKLQGQFDDINVREKAYN